MEWYQFKIVVPLGRKGGWSYQKLGISQICNMLVKIWHLEQTWHNINICLNEEGGWYVHGSQIIFCTLSFKILNNPKVT